MPHFSMRKKMLAACVLATLVFPVPCAFDSPGWTRVAYVLDGDTVILEDGRHVRYIGVNAPETAHDAKPGEPHGSEALALNRSLTQGREVRLEAGGNPRDRYGRTLAFTYLRDGVFVNREMVVQGLAYCLVHSRDAAHFQELLAAQRKAMKAGQGIWADWRHKPQALAGNAHTLRFHKPQCPSLLQANPKNRKPFSSLWEAFDQGYAPCKQCLAAWWLEP